MALHHASSGEIVDLHPSDSKLQERRAKALVKTDSFEAIHLVLPAGDKMDAHKVSGKFTLHCLTGRVRIQLPEKAIELGPNNWVYLDEDIMHSVEGIEASSLLLTIMLPTSGSSSANTESP